MRSQSPSVKTLEYIQKYCEFFVDLCLQEYEFQKFKSIDMAVAIILCARKGVRISPVWSPEFEKMTGKSLAEIEPVFKKIF